VVTGLGPTTAGDRHRIDIVLGAKFGDHGTRGFEDGCHLLALSLIIIIRPLYGPRGKSPGAVLLPSVIGVVCAGERRIQLSILASIKGIRLLGVTVSNFEDSLTDVANELPLFASEVASARRPDTAPVDEAADGR
jgi:hypothetical protein